MYVLDFETERIINGSGLAPRPVGLATMVLGKPETARYMAFAHDSDNNCTEAEARAHLTEIYASGERMIFQNHKFDCAVALEHWGLEWPLGRVEDTMFLLYLYNPVAPTLALKPNSELLLGLPPDEQNDMRDWLISHQKKEWLAEGDKGVNKTNFGAYIARAPGGIVAPYGRGDVIRTGSMFEFLMPDIQQRNLMRGYQREIDLTITGYEMERVGVRVNRAKLIKDYAHYLALKDEAAAKVRELLQCPALDLDKAAQLAKAIEASPLAGPLRRTPTGLLSTAADALVEAITDRELLRQLRYYSTLRTLTGTFFKNWIRFSARDGNVHPSWNQVKGEEYGTRTGRFSCSEPNLANVPTEFGEYDPKKPDDEQDVLWGLDIPDMREYLLPDEGETLVAADYNGQEMRILAHYAEGKALEIYQTDPRADFHEVAVTLVAQAARLHIKRKQAKITGFSLIYGAGNTALAAQLGVPYEQANTIKNAYLKAIPGLAEFQRTFDYRSEVRTWGGRIIPVEPSKMFKGRLWTFNYKLCNHLIQGSAADQMKDAMIRYQKTRAHGNILITVYDELVISCPPEHLASEIKILKAAMEDPEGWDAPFVAEVETGADWHHLTPWMD